LRGEVRFGEAWSQKALKDLRRLHIGGYDLLDRFKKFEVQLGEASLTS